MRFCLCLAMFFLLVCCAAAVRADVVINEFMYDDMSTDDREFVELYNNGVADVDISGWVVRNSDTVAPPTDNNADFTIPGAPSSATTMLAAGDYYVISSFAGVLNVDFVGGGTLENDNEAMELLDGTGTVVDTVIYERNKGPVAITSSEGGLWGNYLVNDLAGSPLNATGSVGRWIDGRDTNNNGRDFGLRTSTPGTSNNTTFMTSYTVPDVSAGTVGDLLPSYGYAFSPPRVIQPTVADGLNPNAITAPPTGSDRALVEWDTTGGGNAAATNEVFNTLQSSFDIYAYLDTTDLPVMSNTAAVEFTGSEVTTYAIGGVDPFNNLTDLSGTTTIVGDSGNGTTGVAWVYEKVGLGPAPGSTPVSEKLYLVDANDGGDSAITGGMDWTILATVDLSATASGWHRLSIAIGNPGDYNNNGKVDGADYVIWRNAGATDTLPNDPTPGTVDASDYATWRDNFGNMGGIGLARYDDQTFNFTTTPFVGAFGVAYRENTQLGADFTPDAIMRPATFVQYVPVIVGAATGVPEPGTIVLAIAGLLLATTGWRRRGPA